MKFLVFFRSREWSNNIVSSAFDKIRKEQRIGNLEGLEIECINLEKRNYERLFNEAKVLPDRIYVWFDEENLMDFVTANFPSVKISVFDKGEVKLPSQSEKNPYAFNPRYEKREYFLADRIMADYKDSFGVKEYWVVDATKMEVKKETISLFELQTKQKKNLKKATFDTEVEAVKFLVDTLMSQVNECDKEVEICEAKIKTVKSKKKKLNTTINKLLKEITEVK